MTLMKSPTRLTGKSQVSVMNILRLMLCALALTAAGSAAAQPERTATAAPAAALAPADARRADLAVFREQFMGGERSYTPAARAEAEARLARLEAQCTSVSQPYFELELARIAALADNGHTHYTTRLIAQKYNRVPVRLIVFGEDFYVARASTANADLLGARLVGIDDKPVAVLRTAARELYGGVSSIRDRAAYHLLEGPELLHVLGLTTSPDAATYRFETRNGQAIERRLVGEPPSAERPTATPQQIFLPQAPSEAWQAALTPARAPWSLQDGAEPFRWRAAPELDAIVLQMRQNITRDGFSIDAALDQFRTAIREAHRRNIVLDMRWNGGGDLSTSRDFMQALPTLAPGRIFILTSPITFSAAISSTGYVKQAAPDRVTIVGEMVGDRLVFFAEGGPVQLPNAAGSVSRATQRHDYANGCRAFSDCHGYMVSHPIAVASLAPDIAAPWTIEAWLAGRDPGMEAVAAALHP